MASNAPLKVITYSMFNILSLFELVPDYKKQNRARQKCADRSQPTKSRGEHIQDVWPGIRVTAVVGILEIFIFSFGNSVCSKNTEKSERHYRYGYYSVPAVNSSEDGIFLAALQGI